MSAVVLFDLFLAPLIVIADFISTAVDFPIFVIGLLASILYCIRDTIETVATIITDSVSASLRTAIITAMCMSVTWLPIFLFDLILRWRTRQILKVRHRGFEDWFLLYMASAHGCDFPILEALSLYGYGTHGRSPMACHDDLILEVGRYLRTHGFRVYPQGSGWKPSHLKWEMIHSDGRVLEIAAEEKMTVFPHDAKKGWKHFGHFTLYSSDLSFDELYRGWEPKEDGVAVTLAFRERLFAALRDFVKLNGSSSTFAKSSIIV